MARKIGPDRLEFVLESKHTNNWCKLERLQESSTGKIQLVAWVEPKILKEIGDHLVEEEHEELRQPSRPQVPWSIV